MVRIFRFSSREMHTLRVPNSIIFRHRSNFDIAYMAAMVEFCAHQRLVSFVSRYMQSSSPFARPLREIFRQTAFLVFCGGETLDRCVATANKINGVANVKSIIDHSTEEKMDEQSWDFNYRSKVLMLEKLAGSGFWSPPSIPIKCTSLLSPIMLEELTSLLEEMPTDISIDDKLIHSLIRSMDERSQELFYSGMFRICMLCSHAKDANISLLLDAEQSFRQPAIEYIARILSEQFNVSGSTPVVFNTYQMYLKRTPAAIKKDMLAAKAGGYTFAGKIVRGAYMISEQARAKQLGVPNPVLNGKSLTDAAYDEIVIDCLQAISQGDSIAVLLATHNRGSIERAVDCMDALGIAKSDSRVHFAQILGMSDHCTFALGMGGYNVSKLVPYGAFEDLLPWLLRRLDENQDILGAMQVDRSIYLAELIRRLRATIAGGEQSNDR